VSQFEGVFGQLSFQTSNFLGRGETASISLQKGSQARQYQLAFTEPYLFDRPISVGIDGQATEFIYPAQFTQDTRGGGMTIGFPIANYTRGFLGYSYQDIRVFDINSLYITPELLAASPYLRDSLLVNQNGERRVGKISPTIVYNTVNQPLFPTAGTRLTAGFDFAGVGGDAQYVSTNLEAIRYFKFTQRMSFGLHAQAQYIRPYGNTTTLPIFEKLFSGGEYTVRGYDIRTISPRDPETGTLVGGNKLVTFNAEYYIDLFSQARLVFFYDAGEVKDVGQPLSWKEPIFGTVAPGVPFLYDPTVTVNFLSPVGSIHSTVLGTTSAVRMSTGVEVRFLMPVLNVPFRLISSYNPNRFGVLNNSNVQTPKFTFRFAVGTQF
jgi:outer membrane protein insertion porin family